MKRISRVWVIAAIAISLFTVSCSKDDSTTNESTYKKPTIAENAPVIEAPTGLQNSDNVYANIAVSYISMANSLSQYAAYFDVPSTATHDSRKSTEGNDTWYWSYQGYSYWMKYWDDATRYYWQYDFETPEISRFTYMKADQLKDGAGGSLEIYSPGLDGSIFTYNWILTSGTYHITIDAQDSQITIVLNSDNSGTLDVVSGEDTLHIQWNADGSGSASGVSGGQTYSFSWSASK